MSYISLEERLEFRSLPDLLYFISFKSFLFFLFFYSVYNINGSCDKPLAIVLQYLLQQTQPQGKSTSSVLLTSSQ